MAQLKENLYGRTVLYTDELEIDLVERHHHVHMAFIVPEAVADVAHLGGAGGDEKHGDILFRKLGMLLLRLGQQRQRGRNRKQRSRHADSVLHVGRQGNQ